MPSYGITKRDVINAAALLVEEAGYHKFSMWELADKMNVKAALLYDHVENMDVLYTGIGCYVMSKLNTVLLGAIKGKHTDEAVTSLATAYHRFAKEHPELYKVVTFALTAESSELLDAAGGIVELIMQVLSMYRLTEEQKVHLQRVLRSIMHGFALQEEHEDVRRFPVSTSESYQLAVEMFIWGIYAIEGV